MKFFKSKEERAAREAEIERQDRQYAEIVEALNAQERAARYQGAPLSDDEIRRIASYQQSFSEMTRGERFVQDVLRAKARSRERWIFGLPLALAALLGLGLLGRPLWRRRSFSL